MLRAGDYRSYAGPARLPPAIPPDPEPVVSNPDAPNPHPSPTCPHCGGPLRLTGNVVNAGRYKKWVERWTCPSHGTVEPSDNPDTDPQSADRGQPRRGDVAS